MKAKKMSAMILAISILFSAAGCGQGNESVSESSNTSAVAEGNGSSAASEDPYAAYRPIEGKDYTVTVAGWLAGPVDNENGEMLDYYQEKTGVRIESVNLDGTQYADLLNIRIASKDIPDVFSIPTFATFQKYYQQGVGIEFDRAMFQEFAPDFYALYEKEYPEGLKIVCLDEERPEVMQGLPQYKYHGQFLFPFVWRQDWLENVGIDKVPDNLEEMEEALYKFAKEDPDGNGQDDTYGISHSGTLAVFAAYGYLPTNNTGKAEYNPIWSERDGKLVCGSIQPEMKEALAKLAQWYQDGIIDPEFLTGENKGGRADVTHAFINDKIGLSLHGDYWTWAQVEPLGLNYMEFSKNHDNVDERLAITTPILANDGESRNTYRASLFSGYVTMFGSHLQDEPDKLGKIFEFYNWVYANEENYTEAWYGLEGKHWEMQNGVPMPIGDYADDKGLQNKIGAYTTVATIVEPLSYQGAIRGTLDKWAKEKGFDNPNYGIRDKLTVTPPSYSQYWSEITKLTSEAYINIITGKAPVDSFDTYVEDFYKYGGDIITQEANEWYEKVNSK